MTRSPRAIGALFFASFSLVQPAWSGTACAHQASVSYGSLELSADRRIVRYQLKVNAGDLSEALGLDQEGPATSEQIRSGRTALIEYLLDRIELTATPGPCRAGRAQIAVEEASSRFAVLQLELRCDRAIQLVTLDYDLFFELDERHTGLVTVGGQLVQLRYPDDTTLEYQPGGSLAGGVSSFLRSGIEHILYGLDHILFVLALLLVAALERAPDGSLTVRNMRRSFAYTARIVTAFTVAHSLTLIAAALGWLEVASRLVESVIAASIILVAAENIARPVPPRRYLITFAFGLVHGLGFASMLRPLLPPEGVVGPLLVFNVGVEIGQLAIVAIAVPCAARAARILGARRYHRGAVVGISAVLIAIAGTWLIERAFAVELVGI